MENNKPINLSEELYNKTQPWVEYLIENYKNPNKYNSCLDVASDNIRALDEIIHLAQVQRNSFETFKKFILQQHEEASQDRQEPPTIAD